MKSHLLSRCMFLALKAQPVFLRDMTKHWHAISLQDYR